MDLRIKVTLNDHNQLLSRYIDTGGTFSTPAFSVSRSHQRYKNRNATDTRAARTSQRQRQ